MTSTWSVYSMVKDRRSVLDRFVQHHLSIGASYVHLFFDDPDDPQYAHFANQPGVIAVRCDASHWADNMIRRPRLQEKRQLANGQLAYDKCLTDWQAHVDSDELLVPGNQSNMRELLWQVDPNCPAALFEPIEPLHGKKNEYGHTPFRRSVQDLNRRQRHRLYGDDNMFLRRGLLGHFHGKSMLRSGLKGWSHGIHVPLPPADAELLIHPMETSRLAHMHCEDKGDWIARTQRRTSDARRALSMGKYGLVDKLHQHHDDPDQRLSTEQLLSDLFDRVNCLSDTLKWRLERFGLLEYHSIPPLPKT
ncbi:hypothetical protein TRL7639_03244 [Falsiruegeria litorea R37]|uniref:Glycosyl transferase family 2 n=1 Tax=Falsiruegeria litorea R37 TaxID=1200284 RepID=A0A1Y5T9H9_9RHOB|nr:glycosyltransferase family 2 protein [Falsiruegeria litorea]SLN58613.1 hypothetical protein TRL7639_03244 [Falsiruegeria litorea R37]